MKWNKPCELEDFSRPEAVSVIQSVEPELAQRHRGYPAGREHRKSWEYQQIIRGANALGALHAYSDVLYAPAGRDRGMVEMTNWGRRVVAADLYGQVTGETASCDPFLLTPEKFVNQRIKLAHLFPRHMDPRALLFDSEIFDLVVCPALSAYPDTPEVVGNLLLEYERVLKPGGILALVVEMLVDGGPPAQLSGAIYHPERVREVVSWVRNLRPIEDLQSRVSDTTLSKAVSLAEARTQASNGSLRFPHVALEEQGRIFTCCTIFSRKLK